MSDQEELRQRREALAQAVNSHDLEAVLSFIDPSFVAKTKRGVSVGYKDMAPLVGQLFAEEKEYHETVEIEKSEVSSDSAELVVRRIERGRLHDPKQVGREKGREKGTGVFLEKTPVPFSRPRTPPHNRHDSRTRNRGH